MLSAFRWVGSLILGMRRGSLFFIWIALEVNVFSFVFLIYLREGRRKLSALSYFLVQCVASKVFFLIFVLLRLSHHTLVDLLFLISLLVKMGAAPFHGWILALTSVISLRLLFLLSSFQKILPLWVFRIAKLDFLGGVVGLGVLVSVLGGIGTARLKNVIVYSSVLNLAWILRSPINIAYLFLVRYRIGLLVLVAWIIVNSNPQIIDIQIYHQGQLNRLLGLIAVFRIAGLPPFLRFFLKITLLHALLDYYNMLISFFLVVGSSFFLYIYRRLIISSLRWRGLIPSWGALTVNIYGWAVCLLLFSQYVFFVFLCHLSEIWIHVKRWFVWHNYKKIDIPPKNTPPLIKTVVCVLQSLWPALMLLTYLEIR